MGASQPQQRGRPAASSRAEIEREGVRLFLEHGFANTTINMIAATAGVSRTSFFRYYRSKAEIIWGAFDEHTQELKRLLGDAPNTARVMDAVDESVVEALRSSVDDEGIWISRFKILDSSSELRSEESEHWLSWSRAVAEFVGERVGIDSRGVVPQTIGGAVQGAFLAILRSWIALPAPSVNLLFDLTEQLSSVCQLLQSWLDSSDFVAETPRV